MWTSQLQETPHFAGGRLVATVRSFSRAGGIGMTGEIVRLTTVVYFGH
jgi:hypothetical protein